MCMCAKTGASSSPAVGVRLHFVVDIRTDISTRTRPHSISSLKSVESMYKAVKRKSKS